MSKQTTTDDNIVTQYSFGLVFIVFAIKISTAFFTSSLSYLVEVSDASLDILMVLITWFALKSSRKPADTDHMFGHYKINSMAGLLQSILIIGLYTGLFYTSVKTLIQVIWFNQPYIVERGGLGAVSLGFVVVLVYFVSQKIISLGKKTQNQVIIAQALNFRGDFYRNISVIVGLILSSFGFAFMDLIIAGFFSVIVIYQGIGIFRQGFNELIDANVLTDDILETIKNQILQISGVDDIEGFALKTAGKNLDANIILRLQYISSQYFSNLISDQVRGIISAELETYLCHIFIQYTFKTSEAAGKERKFSGHLRELIRTSDLSSDIHSIEITRVENSLILHFHLRVDANLTLQEAHTLISESENNIKRVVKQEIPANLDLQIFSHIEPFEGTAQLTEKLSHEVPNVSDINNSLQKLISKYPEILAIKDLQIYPESEEGIGLIFRIFLPQHLNIVQAHAIADALELDLRATLTNIAYCVIHTEPKMEKKE